MRYYVITFFILVLCATTYFYVFNKSENENTRLAKLLLKSAFEDSKNGNESDAAKKLIKFKNEYKSINDFAFNTELISMLKFGQFDSVKSVLNQTGHDLNSIFPVYNSDLKGESTFRFMIDFILGIDPTFSNRRHELDKFLKENFIEERAEFCKDSANLSSLQR